MKANWPQIDFSFLFRAARPRHPFHLPDFTIPGEGVLQGAACLQSQLVLLPRLIAVCSWGRWAQLLSWLFWAPLANELPGTGGPTCKSQRAIGEKYGGVASVGCRNPDILHCRRRVWRGGIVFSPHPTARQFDKIWELTKAVGGGS